MLVGHYTFGKVLKFIYNHTSFIVFTNHPPAQKQLLNFPLHIGIFLFFLFLTPSRLRWAPRVRARRPVRLGCGGSGPAPPVITSSNTPNLGVGTTPCATRATLDARRSRRTTLGWDPRKEG